MENYDQFSRKQLLKKIAELEKSNRKYQSLNKIVSSIDALIWKTELSPDGELINSYASANIHEFMGLGKESEDDSFYRFFDYVHPDDREETKARLFSSLKSLTSSFQEYRLVLPDGNIRWLRSIGTAAMNENGNPEATGITLDITKWKEAELKLEESRQNYKNLFYHSPDPIIIHRNGVFVALNKAALQFAEKEDDSEMLGKPVQDFVHPDFREFVIERMKQVIAGEKNIAPAEVLYIRPSGEEVWVETFPTYVSFNNKRASLVVFRDISERKRNIQKLKENEARFRAFTESVKAAVFTYDSQGFLGFVNRATAELTGYSSEELQQMHISKVIADDFKELVLSRAKDRIKGLNPPSSYDAKIVRKDGEVRWIQFSNNKLDLEGSDLALGSAIDIHDRKLMEEKLKESEEQFRNLFDKSSDAMLLIRDGAFFSCNQAAMSMLKAEKKEQVFISPHKLSPNYQPDGQLSSEKAANIIQNTLETGFSRFEWVHRDLEGQDFWCDISLTLMPADNEQVIHTIWRDISAQKKMERQIIEDKEQLSVTLKSIGDAVITTDLHGNVEIMNRVAEKLTGWDESDAKGLHVNHVFNIVNGVTGEKAINPIEEVIRTGINQSLEKNTILISKDGTRYNIDDSGAPIRDKESRIIGGVLVFRDITESHKMQEEIMKLRKLDSISRLAGGIAHDFNNLLTGIQGNIQFAYELAEEDSKIRKHLTMAGKASNRAAELTNRLLTFSKGGEPIKETASIPDLIHESTEFILHGSKIKAEFRMDANLWHAQVDKGQISQVIQNLVLNSKEAMPEGGTIQIHCSNKTLRNSTIPLPNGNYVLITIKDEGTGITAENIEKIFDPFFTTKVEGSGLGLSVIHSIIQKHNGFIGVESKRNKGTTISVYLPATEGQAPFPTPKIMPNHSSQRKYKILVMDDEQLILDTVATILMHYGYEVDTTETGSQAIEMYRQTRYDLIILDMTIPGDIGGEEVLKKIKVFDPNVKAIVSSGFSTSPVMANYEEYGFAGVVSKPYRVSEMQNVIMKILAT